ncbi:MAG: creatininase family protein [Sphingomonadaceae bacterium]
MTQNLVRAMLTCLLLGCLSASGVAQSRAIRGILLADLNWQQAEKVLSPETVVVIPLGAEAKEHGPHLRLDNDLKLARYFTRRVLAAVDVVVAPTLTYSYYPAFLEYPGSTSLRLETARDTVVDVVRSFAGYGVRRFYVLNTGVSTLRPLAAAAEMLAKEGIVLRYTDIARAGGEVEKQIAEQKRGSHADEIETSMMLYIAPDRVDMRRAVRDDNPDAPGPLRRTPGGKGVYSPSGIWGDPTLATRAKGKLIVEARLRSILVDIQMLKTAALANAP